MDPQARVILSHLQTDPRPKLCSVHVERKMLTDSTPCIPHANFLSLL
jgi:hypothetical protein